MWVSSGECVGVGDASVWGVCGEGWRGGGVEVFITTIVILIIMMTSLTLRVESPSAAALEPIVQRVKQTEVPRGVQARV